MEVVLVVISSLVLPARSFPPRAPLRGRQRSRRQRATRALGRRARRPPAALSCRTARTLDPRAAVALAPAQTPQPSAAAPLYAPPRRTLAAPWARPRSQRRGRVLDPVRLDPHVQGCVGAAAAARETISP
eukprot:scaffold113896_cov35-Phaeocystis_antarctica.AAC.5